MPVNMENVMKKANHANIKCYEYAVAYIEFVKKMFLLFFSFCRNAITSFHFVIYTMHSS